MLMIVAAIIQYYHYNNPDNPFVIVFINNMQNRDREQTTEKNLK